MSSLQTATGLGTETMQSQLRTFSQGGAGFTQQAAQLLEQLPHQLQQTFTINETTSTFSSGLAKLQQALSHGPAGASAAFSDFTANFHWQLGNAGLPSPQVSTVSALSGKRLA